MRKAMMLDAEWHHAQTQYNAACEVPNESGSESRRQARVAWQKEHDAQPERQKRHNAQRRAQRAAARMST
jgi:hypothetical protein